MVRMSRRGAAALFLALPAVLLGAAQASAQCNTTQRGDRVVTVRLAVTLSSSAGACRLQPGNRIGVNNKCGCVGGSASCTVSMRGGRTGAIPEIAGGGIGNCTIRRGARCKPRHPRDCP